MKYLHTIDQKGQELRSSSLEKLAAEPTTGLFDSRRYYNTTTNIPYIYIQGVWHSLINVQVVDDVLSLHDDISCVLNPDYPIAEKGWTYLVSSAGRIGGATGIEVAVGDLIIAKTDNPTAGNHASVGSNFSILERNLNKATDTASGVIRLATTAEITAGATDVAIPTVGDVTDMIANVSSAGTASEDLLPGNTSYSFTHGLNGIVSVTLVNKATGDYVIPGVQRISNNNVLLTVNPALSAIHVACATKVGAAL